MLDHRTRTWLIWGLTLAALIAIVVADVYGGSAVLMARLETALALLIPATLDATAEGKKQARLTAPPQG